jgi:hypothetical protein
MQSAGMSQSEPGMDATEVQHCRIVDAFKLERGRITRDAETESLSELLHPILVNLQTGVVKVGAAGAPVAWGIVQQGEAGWDFVAVRSEPGDTVLSTIRIRTWEEPIQMVMIVNGFTFATGICEPLSDEELAAAVAGTQPS